jgi:HSP20 family protein
MRVLTLQLSDLERWALGLDRLLGSVLLREQSAALWHPPTDVYETDNAVVIKVEVAGLRAEDFLISFEDKILQIRGQRPDTQRKTSAHCLEIPYGEFVSQVYLPGYYANDKIDANYENGFLTITLLKVTPDTQNIVIQTKDSQAGLK